MVKRCVLLAEVLCTDARYSADMGSPQQLSCNTLFIGHKLTPIDINFLINIPQGEVSERERARDDEVGGPKGPEPTRFGDWEKGGRCTDF